MELKMKIKRILIFIFLILGLSSMIMLLIKQPNLIPPKAPKTLKDLAYDSDKRLGYTIYIPENGKLEPYLVLTKNYYKQGNVLLIRKYVLEVPLPHNKKMRVHTMLVVFQIGLLARFLLMNFLRN